MIQNLFVLAYKAFRKLISNFHALLNFYFCWLLFYLNGMEFSSFKTNGIPFVMVALGGKCTIGKGFRINNELKGNPIGRPQKCTFVVDKGAELKIGNNVGMSSTAIVAHQLVEIDDNVKIGGGTCIYDTDFHSLNSELRNNFDIDREHKANAPVHIKKNAFIGAHSTILKGVTIGENAIIGACSVVTKSVPDNEIWAGNPARFIKTIADIER